MKPSIRIRIKYVYGKETIYPVCAVARNFAMIAGTSTLTKRTLALIESLGYLIQVEHQVLAASNY